MKNKSKLKSIKEKRPAVVKLPSQWLLLAKEAVAVRQLKEALDDYADVELEIWDAAGVLEVVLPDGKSMDFEETEVDLRDEYSNDFLAQHETRALFYVTIHPDSAELVKPVMQHVLAKVPGLFCGDTDDFTPVVR